MYCWVYPSLSADYNNCDQIMRSGRFSLSSFIKEKPSSWDDHSVCVTTEIFEMTYKFSQNFVLWSYWRPLQWYMAIYTSTASHNVLILWKMHKNLHITSRLSWSVGGGGENMKFWINTNYKSIPYKLHKYIHTYKYVCMYLYNKNYKHGENVKLLD